MKKKKTAAAFLVGIAMTATLCGCQKDNVAPAKAKVQQLKTIGDSGGQQDTTPPPKP